MFPLSTLSVEGLEVHATPNHAAHTIKKQKFEVDFKTFIIIKLKIQANQPPLKIKKDQDKIPAFSCSQTY
jgi:hypothetical protein